ncbi:Uncharacterised protein [Enterobacter cloacae]|nr:Uncharacterised protein [Enterobacter cloacae]
MGNVLAIIDLIFLKHKKTHPELKEFIKNIIIDDVKRSSAKDSVFDVLWLVFFTKFRQFGIGDISKYVDSVFINNNKFYQCLVNNKPIFIDDKYALFKKPKDLNEIMLIEYVDLFKRD